MIGHIEYMSFAELAGLTGPIGRRVRSRRRDLITAAAGHGITHLRVFGSVARGSERPDSDIDLLVDLPPGMSLFRLARAQDELEAIVGAPVDLVPASDLKPGVRPRVERELIALSSENDGQPSLNGPNR